MGINKLAVCCVIGILLGFLVPVIFPIDRYTMLMIGLIGGLGVGYLLDKRDEQKGKENSAKIANKKAREANRLMERARAGLEDETLRMAEDDGSADDYDEPESETYEAETGSDDLEKIHDYEAEAAEEAQKLNDAEELLRKARERIK